MPRRRIRQTFDPLACDDPDGYGYGDCLTQAQAQTPHQMRGVHWGGTLLSPAGFGPHLVLPSVKVQPSHATAMDLNEDFQPTWYDRRCRRRKSIRHLGHITLGAYGDQPYALAANRGAIICYGPPAIIWYLHMVRRHCMGTWLRRRSNYGFEWLLVQVLFSQRRSDETIVF